MSMKSRTSASFSSMESFNNDFNELDELLLDFKNGKNPSISLENTKLHAEIHLAITAETFEYVGKLCDFLFTIYRDVRNRTFVLQFLPSFITIYHDLLYERSSTQKTEIIKDVRTTVDTFFVGLYNLSVLDETGALKIYEFRIPNLTLPSIYHTPNADLYSPTPLTRHAVSKHENKPEFIHLQTFTPFDVVNATTREQILWFLLIQYGMNVSAMDGYSCQSYIYMSNKLLGQGFSSSDGFTIQSTSTTIKSTARRIHVSSRIMTEILGALFYFKANSKAKEIADCMRLLKERAEYELYPDVIMMTESMNFLHEFESQKAEGQDTIGIELELPPTVDMVKQRRSATTARSMKNRQRTNRHHQQIEQAIAENDLTNETVENTNFITEPSETNPKISISHEILTRPSTINKLGKIGSTSESLNCSVPSERSIKIENDDSLVMKFKSEQLSGIEERKMSIESSNRAVSSSPSPTSRRQYQPVSLTSTQTYFQTLQQQRASSPNFQHVQTILHHDPNLPLSRGSSLKHQDKTNLLTTVRFLGTDENRTNHRETFL